MCGGRRHVEDERGTREQTECRMSLYGRKVLISQTDPNVVHDVDQSRPEQHRGNLRKISEIKEINLSFKRLLELQVQLPKLKITWMIEGLKKVPQYYRTSESFQSTAK